MLSIRIIPCLDVAGGRVVKGVKFQALKDAGDPVEAAKAYEDQGADELVFLDITASSEERDSTYHVVERVASECFMPLTVGGGLRSVDNIRTMLNAGADKVSLNTAVIQNSELLRQTADQFGSQCIVVAIDAKKSKKDERQWQVYTHGGCRPTELDAIEWARHVVALGAGEILLTSMDQDGTHRGYDIELTRRISEAVSVPVIASGGAGNLDHLIEVLTKGKASAVLAASIFHFGPYTIPEAKQYLSQARLPVRLL